ncbi:MAG: hypothetical protein IT283_01240 [Bacteroidetes bacterium]|nr:hypothetical protein [Bacteroidota bacterium]
MSYSSKSSKDYREPESIMSRNCKHLIQEQRYEIRAMYLQGISYSRMGVTLGVLPSPRV